MIAGLFNQTITVYSKSGYDAYGRETVGAGTDVQCRFQRSTKRRLMPNGSLAVIDAVCYVPADTTVATDDRVTYDSTDYKVYIIDDAVGGNGDTHHIKLELIKWQR